MTAGCVGLFAWEYFYSFSTGFGSADSLQRAQTMAVTTVIAFQVFYLFNCRSLRYSVLHIGVFSNKTVFAGIGAIALLQALFIYFPPLQAVFETSALSFKEVLISVLAGSVILPVISIEKRLMSRKQRIA
jgi:Ca2+-transporting ATPase